MFLLPFLFACGAEIALNPGLGACEDFDWDNPAPSALEVTWMGEDQVTITRTNVPKDHGNYAFSPQIVPVDDVVEIYEDWTLSGDGDGLEFCYAPKVDILGGADGKQVRWFLAPGDTIPFATVNLEAP